MDQLILYISHTSLIALWFVQISIILPLLSRCCLFIYKRFSTLFFIVLYYVACAVIMFVCLACVFITFNSFIVLLASNRIRLLAAAHSINPVQRVVINPLRICWARGREGGVKQIKGEWQQLLGLHKSNKLWQVALLNAESSILLHHYTILGGERNTRKIP